MKQKTRKKVNCLGQIISAGGLANSISQMIRPREGKIRAACLEIATIANDWRAKVTGGMEMAIML